jgi:hypothetical protein
VNGDRGAFSGSDPAAFGLALGLARLVVVAGLGSGCVLPIGPEFAEEKNAPPFVVSVRPPVGSALTSTNLLFDVTFQDPNPVDTLYARWLIDYPPYNPEISRVITVPALPASNPNLPNLQQIRFTPGCEGEDALSPTLSRHRLMLVVTDRPFGPNMQSADTSSDGFAITLTWTFDKDCPSR